MIADLTKHGVDFKKNTLTIRSDVLSELRPKYTDDFIFRGVREPSYREFMSPFHTGSQEERKEKRILKEEHNYGITDVRCPICGKIVKILPWRRLTGCCSDCALDVNALYDTKTCKERFDFTPRDRTQWILDIWNRNY